MDLRRVALQACLLAIAASSAPALAKKNGIAAMGCDGCHGGGLSAVNVTLDPPTFSQNQTIKVTVSFASTGSGGLYLYDDSVGAFSLIAGQPTRLINSNAIVHTAPKLSGGGTVTFQVNWKAPATPSGVAFHAWAVAANGDNNAGGDKAGYGVKRAVFGCAGSTYYRDFDGDNYGNSANGITLDCKKPSGYAVADGDCDENERATYPGAPEVCDAHDNDCDGSIDEGAPVLTYYPDLDGDGYGVFSTTTVKGCGAPAGYGVGTGDCDDGDSAVHPNATELCNAVDDDCDNRVDEGARKICGVGMCSRYAVSCTADLCTPGDPVPETCNGLDDDCDGAVDNGSGAELCGAGQICLDFRCDVDDGGVHVNADGGPVSSTPSEPGSPKTASCAAVPGLWGALGLAGLVLLRRRRRAR